MVHDPPFLFARGERISREAVRGRLLVIILFQGPARSRKSAARLSFLFPARYAIRVIYANPLRRSFPLFSRDGGRAPGKIVGGIMTLVSRKLLVAAGNFAIPRGNLLAVERSTDGNNDSALMREGDLRRTSDR